MSTVSPSNTNRLLFFVALPLVLALAVLAGWMFARMGTTPQNSDTTRLAEELKTLNKDLKEQLERAQANSSNKDVARPEAKEAINKFSQEIDQVVGQLNQRITELQKQQQEANKRGDKTEAKQNEELIKQHREQMDALKEQLRKYQDQVAAANKSDPIPPPPIPLVPLTTSDTSDKAKEIVKGILRIGLLGLCVYNPALAPIVMAIAHELGLFGNEVETRAVYLKAVEDVAMGRPINPTTQKQLDKAKDAGKIPGKMLEHLEALKKAAQAIAKTQTAKGNKKDPATFVEDVAKAMQEKKPLSEVRQLFPTAEDQPYYRSTTEKQKIEELFKIGDADLKAKYWEGTEGLGSIKVKE